MQITVDTGALIGAVSFFSGAIGAMAVAWTRVVRPIQRIAEDWHGEPARPDAGIPERPGMMLRMARMEAEMHPNHGGSLRDAVNRMDVNLAAHVASHAVALYAPPPQPYGQDGTQHGGQAQAA